MYLFACLFGRSIHTCTVTERHPTRGLLAWVHQCCPVFYQTLLCLSSFIIRKLCTDFIRSLFHLSYFDRRMRKTTNADVSLSLSGFVLGVSGQRVKVEPEVSSYPGQTVNLRCAFTDATGTQLTMVRCVFLLFSFGIGLGLYTSTLISVLNWLCGVKNKMLIHICSHFAELIQYHLFKYL